MITGNAVSITAEHLKRPTLSVEMRKLARTGSLIRNFIMTCLRAVAKAFRGIRNEVDRQAYHHNYSPKGSERWALENRGVYIRGIL